MGLQVSSPGSSTEKHTVLSVLCFVSFDGVVPKNRGRTFLSVLLPKDMAQFLRFTDCE